jgi:hypothetical protein
MLGLSCWLGAHPIVTMLRTTLQGRVSSDPNDPEILALEERLALLGPAPRRAGRLTAEQMAAARAAAEAKVGLDCWVAVVSQVAAAFRMSALGSTCTCLNTHPLPTALLTNQQLVASPSRSHYLEPVLTVGTTAAMRGTGSEAAARVHGPRFTGQCRYYARLLINNKVVGTSQSVKMHEDFTVDFSDVFR